MENIKKISSLPIHEQLRIRKWLGDRERPEVHGEDSNDLIFWWEYTEFLQSLAPKRFDGATAAEIGKALFPLANEKSHEPMGYRFLRTKEPKLSLIRHAPV